jgi:hypothetical protein
VTSGTDKYKLSIRRDEFIPVFLSAARDGIVSSAFKNVSLDTHRIMAAQLYFFLSDAEVN